MYFFLIEIKMHPAAQTVSSPALLLGLNYYYCFKVMSQIFQTGKGHL